MRVGRINKVLEHIDEELIFQAVHYKRNKNANIFVKFTASVACFLLIISVLSYSSGQNEGPESHSPATNFIINAYAKDSDNFVNEYIMEHGVDIPVSFFVADNGLSGFVFSYESESPQEYLSFSVMTEGDGVSTANQIEAINGLDLDKNRNYIFYIPRQNENNVYRVPLTRHDDKTNTVALLIIRISLTDEGYKSTIEEISVYERKDAPK